MQLRSLFVATAAALVLSGCNKAESPAETRQDVAQAEAEGQRDVADARADAKEDYADARKDVSDAVADNDANDTVDQQREANETALKGNSNIRIAQAEAAHKVAVEKCESLTGAAQKQCKDDADVTLDQTKDAVKMSR